MDSLNNIVKNEEPLDSALAEYIMVGIYSASVKNNQFEGLEDSVPLRTPPLSVSEEIGISILNSHLLNNRYGLESSSKILSGALDFAINDKQKLLVLYASYRHELCAENYQRAALMADSIIKLQSKVVEEILTESVTGVQRDFYSIKARYQEKKSKDIQLILITIILIAIFIIVLLGLIYQLNIRAKKAELETNVSSLLSLKDQVEYVSTENRRLHMELTDKSVALESLRQKLDSKSQAELQNMAVIEHLFKEKWATLNMLCNEYFEMGESAATRNAILSRIEKELKKLRAPKQLKEIETAVDLYMGNIMTLLRKECDFLKEEDFVFLSLIFAGLSVRAVCMFTGIKYKLYYLKKSRLSKRISESNVPHKSLFIGRIK